MIEIKNYTKIYKGGKKAVDNLTLTVENGDLFGFIGSNGAGKTTTLKAVAGILTPSSGEIIINGKSMQKEPLLAKAQIAYIPDNPDLYEFMTGNTYLNFIADIFNISERQTLIETYAKLFEIYDNLSSPISSYSHGMKQKLAIISALIHNPKVLILDEPFVGLDPKSSHTLKEIFAEFCKNGGSILFSTHILEVAQKICNKIAIIKDGKLIMTGNTDEVTKNRSLEDLFLELSDENK